MGRKSQSDERRFDFRLLSFVKAAGEVSKQRPLEIHFGITLISLRQKRGKRAAAEHFTFELVWECISIAGQRKKQMPESTSSDPKSTVKHAVVHADKAEAAEITVRHCGGTKHHIPNLLNATCQRQVTPTVKTLKRRPRHPLPCAPPDHARYSLCEDDRVGLEGDRGGGREVAGTGGGAGLVPGTGAGAASTSGAGAVGTRRTLLTRSVSRDTGRGSRQDG